MIVLLLILLILLLLYFNINQIEGFEAYSPWDIQATGKFSDNCYEVNNNDCLKYANCGLCTNGNQTQCIPGDVDGAFFKEGCQNWTYTNYYDRNIFDENITTSTITWDAFLPGYEVMYPSPTSVFR